MPKQKAYGKEVRLTLTDEQRAQLVRLIAEAKTASLQADICFEADVAQKTIAPVAVMVGPAV